MLMFVRDDERFLAQPDLGKRYAAINDWFVALGSRYVEGEQLQPQRNATTVRWAGGQPLVTDGPFLEAKEAVAGYAVIEVADLDDAIDLARRWPAQDHAVEIRPIVPMEMLGRADAVAVPGEDRSA